MSVVLASLASTAAVIGILSILKKPQRSSEVLAALKESAVSNHMNMDAAFTWKNRGLVVDKGLGKLIYVEHDGQQLNKHVVNINTLKECEIIKGYSTSGKRPGNTKFSKKHLASIGLQLRTEGDNNCKYTISFYNEKLDKVSEMKALFQKAWHWKRLIIR